MDEEHESEANVPDDYNPRNSYDGVDPVVVTIARSMARKAVGRDGLTASDLADLEQMLILDTLVVVEKNKDRITIGPAFVKAVVGNRLKSIFRYRRSSIRDWRKSISLNTEVAGDDGEETAMLIDFLSSEGNLGLVERSELNPLDPMLRRMDIYAAMARLPPELYRLSEELMHKSVREIAAVRKVPLSAIYLRIAKIRKIFLAYLDDVEPQKSRRRIQRFPSSREHADNP